MDERGGDGCAVVTQRTDNVVHKKEEFGEGRDSAFGCVCRAGKTVLAEAKNYYKMMQEYVERNYGFKIHTAYIAE